MLRWFALAPMQNGSRLTSCADHYNGDYYQYDNDDDVGDEGGGGGGYYFYFHYYYYYYYYYGVRVVVRTAKREIRGSTPGLGTNLGQDFCFMRTPTPPLRPSDHKSVDTRDSPSSGSH